MTTNTDAPASFTVQEKEGLANDLHMIANQLIDNGSYIFNLIAAVNAQTEILIRSNLCTEKDIEELIEKEVNKMRAEFKEQQKIAT